MLRLTALLWLALIAPPVTAPAWAGSLADLDAKNGFRGFQFGSVPTKDMALVESGGDKKYYSRPSDDLRIGEAKVHRIIYKFYRNRYASTMIETKGLVNSSALLRVLQEGYGPGSRPNEYLAEYYWFGAKVIASYDENAVTHDARVWLGSTELMDQEKADDKTKAKKGASDL